MRRSRVRAAVSSILVAAGAAGAALVSAVPAQAAVTASATPSSNLTDGTSVAVSASGYASGATVYVLECADSTGSSTCNTGGTAVETADSSGNLTSVPFVVHTGAIGGGTCTVASTTCNISVSDGTGPGTYRIPVTFAPSATGTPTTNVTDGSSISLSGKGFAPASNVYVLECSGPAQADCDTAGTQVANSDASGNVSASFKAKVGVVGDGSCTYGVTTCTFNLSGGSASSTAGVPFTTGPSAVATPSTGLKDGTSVSIVGHGFVKSTLIAALECNGGPGGGAACDTNHVVTFQSTAAGDVSTTVVVHTGTIGNGTCTSASTACVIAVTDPAGKAGVNLPIHFAAEDTTPPPAVKGAVSLSLKLAKSTIKSNQKGSLTVKATGKGFVPTGKVTVLKGKKTIASGTLKSGKVTIKLPKLGKGSYTLTVQYPGSSVALSTHKTIKLTVQRAI